MISASVNNIIKAAKVYQYTSDNLDKIKHATDNKDEWQKFVATLPDARIRENPTDPNSPQIPNPYLHEFTKPLAIKLYENDLEANPILKADVKLQGHNTETNTLIHWMQQYFNEKTNYEEAIKKQKDKYESEYQRWRLGEGHASPQAGPVASVPFRPTGSYNHTYEEDMMEGFNQEIRLREKFLEEQCRGGVGSLAPVGESDEIMRMRFEAYVLLKRPDLSTPIQYNGLTEDDIKTLTVEAASVTKAKYEKDKVQTKKILKAIKTDSRIKEKSIRSLLEEGKVNEDMEVNPDVYGIYKTDDSEFLEMKDLLERAGSIEQRNLDFYKQFPELPPEVRENILDFEDLKNELISYLEKLLEKINDCGNFGCNPNRHCVLDQDRTRCNKSLKSRLENTSKLIKAFKGDKDNPSIFDFDEFNYEFMFLKVRLISQSALDFSEERFLEAYDEFAANKANIMIRNLLNSTIAIDTQIAGEWLEKTGSYGDPANQRFVDFRTKRSREMLGAILGEK
ncbi:MAG: hypothetical protein HY072_08390 [Deltaproteobacteria bacterium]|nr:hypothetical protein [Deltaproteobacteria bacterium]